ncbi:DprA-like winged helix domain-containing protein [Coprococcus catus]|uniref:DprA-like winged helix domain-containing protein n=1 Tax=Coprococcus catus TaxID=116085 RepID=UPI003A7F47B1
MRNSLCSHRTFLTSLEFWPGNTKKNNITLDNSEKVVYASICLVPRSADEIALLTGMEVQNVIHNLISMELKGIIHSVGKNQYVLNI